MNCNSRGLIFNNRGPVNTVAVLQCFPPEYGRIDEFLFHHIINRATSFNSLVRALSGGWIAGTVRTGQQADGLNDVGDELEPCFFGYGLGAVAFFIRIKEAFNETLNRAGKRHRQGLCLADKTHLYNATEASAFRRYILAGPGIHWPVLQGH